MAGHAADLRIQRRRAEHIEHIHQLTAEIADRGHVAAQLLSFTVRVTYYFFMFAFLIAGLVAFIAGRTDSASLWGGLGLGLLFVLIVVKGGSRIMRRAIGALREEMAKAQPVVAADSQPGAEPATEPATEPAAEQAPEAPTGPAVSPIPGMAASMAPTAPAGDDQPRLLS